MRASANLLFELAHNFVSTPVVDAHVRQSTLPLKRVPFPCSSSEYRRQATNSLIERLRAQCLYFGDGLTRRSASSQSARVRRRAPFCGGRLACRAVAPYTPQSVLAELWYFAGTPYSRRENAETFASLLVPWELSRSSLISTPRGCKRTRAPHRRYSDCYAKRQSRHSSAPGSPPKVFSVGLIRGPRVKIFDFRLG